VDSNLFYYVNNVPVKDCVRYLPGYEDASTKLYYRFDENGTCTGKASGIVEVDGNLYYAVNGVRTTGWQTVRNTDGGVDYYYFNTWSGRAVDGAQTINGYDYIFTDRVLTRGEIVTNATGSRYMWAGSWATQEWLEIDGNIYYARSSSYFATGFRKMFSPEGVKCYYIFDDNGVWQKDANGFYEYNGETYLADHGFLVEYPGLVYIDGHFYYFTSLNTMIKNRTYWLSKPNGYVPEGSYRFDEQGRMVDFEDVFDPDSGSSPTLKNGFYDEHGGIYHYTDGKLSKSGLIYVDGYYYYVRTTTGEVVANRAYWITYANGLMPSARYNFDELGRMIDPPGAVAPTPTPEPGATPAPTPTPKPLKNGFYTENGAIYHYKDG